MSKIKIAVVYTMELSDNLNNKMPKRQTYFPIEIVEIILKRLPSTSIARFQTVSKQWCDIIRSFILNAHSKSSLMSIQLSTTINSGKLAHFNFDDEGKTINSIRKLNLGGTLNYNLSNMVNGLACAYGNKTTTNFYLMNLTTFETSKYTKRKIKGIYKDQITLGFDPSTSLYKFIRIYSNYKNCSFHCEILKTGDMFKGDWKVIGEIPHMVPFDKPVFVNGAIHWMMHRLLPLLLTTSKSLTFDLLKLNVKDEKFETVTSVLQNEVGGYDYQFCDRDCSFSLSEENGKLYMLHYCCHRKYLYGWRLKENNGGCVWNIVFHANLESMVEKEPGCLLHRHEYPYVVGIADGKVLIRSVRSNKGVYIYDILHKKLSKHWDIDHGSFPAGINRRRMLFSLK